MRQLVVVAAVLAALVCVAPAQAAERFDVLDTATSGHLQPVRGSDGRQHLVYQLRVHNLSSELSVVVESVIVRDARTHHSVFSLSGDTLLASMSLGDGFNPVPTTTLGPGQAGVVYLAPTFASLRAVPQRIEHVLQVAPAPGSDAALFDSRFGRAITGPSEAVDHRLPLVLGAPLWGDGYLALNGCCDSPGHVKTILSVGGVARSAERFAIDWIQADRQGRLDTGDGTRNEDYFIYGDPIHAVADGRVLVATDGAPDTPALGRTTGTVRPDLAAGNVVIQSLRRGLFGMYAHIAPGTIRVKPGQRVRRGQVLGLVGSTGNSDAPHLHFQVMDRPSPLGADGWPYVHQRFGLQGQVVDEAVQWLPKATSHVAELPLNNTVIGFPGG
jgi:murein DD-endopeptidase MepM/ murein hydrolase activator NlpD